MSTVLNSLFFGGKETFVKEKNQSHGQLALYNLLETAICNGSENKNPIEIWYLRGNALLDANSKYLDLIFDSASSILIFANESFIPTKYIHTFNRKLDIFKALTTGDFQNNPEMLHIKRNGKIDPQLNLTNSSNSHTIKIFDVYYGDFSKKMSFTFINTKLFFENLKSSQKRRNYYAKRFILKY